MEKKTLLQENVRTLAQVKGGDSTTKQKMTSKLEQIKEKKSTYLDYLDEDRTKLEAIEPAQETPKETLKLQGREIFNRVEIFMAKSYL